MSTDTNAVTDIDVANNLRADTHGNTDDFVSDTARIYSGALLNSNRSLPPYNRYGFDSITNPLRSMCRSEPGIPVVGDLEVDVGLFPRFWLELLPDQLALVSLVAKAHPALELVINLFHRDTCSIECDMVVA